MLQCKQPAVAGLLELAGGILVIVLAGLTFNLWGWDQPLVALTFCLPLLIICWFRSRHDRAATTNEGAV